MTGFLCPLALRLAQLRFLEYWNTFEKHDSLLHNSTLLSHCAGRRPAKPADSARGAFQNTANLRLHWKVPKLAPRRSCLGPTNCDLLVLNCRYQKSSGARGFSIFDFAPGSPFVASRCWRGVCILIDFEKLSLVRHYSFLLFGRFSIVLGISRLGCAAERTKFDAYWSHFDRWCAG
jgi:hypothetical protein